MPKVDIKKKIVNPFDSDSENESNAETATNGKGFNDSDDLENKSVQELENYAAYKSEETTRAVNDCVRIAETIKEDATRTLITLNEQGEQINRTHDMCTKIDQDLSKGESLLNSLGGMFSKTWKPKKTRKIKGPDPTPSDSHTKKKSHLKQREKLGISTTESKDRHYSEPTTAMEKVQVEKAKQNDSLDDLSGILGDLKGMAVDMGTEIERQNKALDGLNDDVEELNSRVKGANRRARQLVGR